MVIVTAFRQFVVGALLLLHIHRLQADSLGIDAHAARGLAFGIGGRDIGLLGTDSHLAVCREGFLLGLAVLYIGVDTRHSEGLRVYDDVALRGVVGLGHLALIIHLHVGRVLGGYLDGLGAQFDLAVGGELFLLVFLIGHLIIDSLDGDVLRRQLEVALSSEGTLLKFTLIVEFQISSACCSHFNVLGHNAHPAFLIQCPILIQGSDAHRVGCDGDTRFLVVAQVVLAVGRQQDP